MHDLSLCSFLVLKMGTVWHFVVLCSTYCGSVCCVFVAIGRNQYTSTTDKGNQSNTRVCCWIILKVISTIVMCFPAVMLNYIHGSQPARWQNTNKGNRCTIQIQWTDFPIQSAEAEIIWATYREKAQEKERHSGSWQGKFSGFLRHHFYAATCVPLHWEGKSGICFPYLLISSHFHAETHS